MSFFLKWSFRAYNFLLAAPFPFQQMPEVTVVIPIKDFIGALPTVAQSPYALAGYLAVVVAWILISFRVNRNKNLLKHLSTLPEQDRLPALRLEMGAVAPKDGLSATQYVQLVQRRYYFLAFSLVVVLLAGLIVGSWYFESKRDHGAINVDITPVVPTSSDHQ